MPESTAKVLEDSARGGFFLTIGNTVSTIISALSVLIIARILGSELYGLYTISTVIPTLLLLFVNPGVDQGIIKYAASLKASGEENRIAELLTQGLFLKTVLGIVGSAVCFIFSNQFARYVLNRPDVTWYIQLASSLILLQAIYTTTNSAFISIDRSEYNALTTAIQATIKAVAAPILIIIGLSVTGALTGYLLSCFLAASLGVCLFIAKIYKPSNRSNRSNGNISSNLRLLIGYGLPLYLSALLGGFAAQYQNILLAIFTSDYDIGNFKAAMNFTVLISSLAIPIATILLPAFSKLESREHETKEFFTMSIKYSSVVIVPVATVLMIYAREIVEIIYGGGYEPAAAYLSLNTLQFFLVGLGSIVLGSFFSGLGETRINLRITLANSIIIILLSPILTWLLKINGMIITVIFASAASTLYALHLAKSKFKVRVNVETTAKIYMVSAASAMPTLALQKILPIPCIIQVILGTTTYLVTYLLLIPTTKIVTKPELNEIKTVMEKIKPLKMVARPIFFIEERILSRMP